MSHRRTARRRVLRAAAPPRQRQHEDHRQAADDVAGCSCPDPTYSTGLMGFGDFPGEDALVAMLRCKACGLQPPAGWDPWAGGDAASGAGGAPGRGDLPTSSASFSLRWL